MQKSHPLDNTNGWLFRLLYVIHIPPFGRAWVGYCLERINYYYSLLSIHSMMSSLEGRGASREMMRPFLSNIMKRGMPSMP